MKNEANHFVFLHFLQIIASQQHLPHRFFVILQPICASHLGGRV